MPVGGYQVVIRIQQMQPVNNPPRCQIVAVTHISLDKIVVHEREKKGGRRTLEIDIYYSYVGIVDIPTDGEMRESEQQYMQRTTCQTA